MPASRFKSSRVEQSRVRYENCAKHQHNFIGSSKRAINACQAQSSTIHIPARNTRIPALSPPSTSIHAFDSMPSISIYPSIRLSVYLFRCLPPFGASVLLLLPPPSLLPTLSPSLLTNAHQSAHNGDGIIVFVFSMQSYAKYIHDFHTHTHTMRHTLYIMCVSICWLCVCVCVAYSFITLHSLLYVI